MCLRIRRQRPSLAADPVEQFHRDVLACSRALEHELPALGNRYSVEVLTVCLTMHLTAMLRLCLREGHLTASQVDLLVAPLLQSGRPSECRESVSEESAHRDDAE